MSKLTFDCITHNFTSTIHDFCPFCALESLRHGINSLERDLMSGKESLCEMSDDACRELVDAFGLIKKNAVKGDDDE